MSAKVLTKAAAKEAKIEIIEGGRGTQAVHDAVVAMRAARRSGSANTKTKAAPGPVTNRRRFGVAVALFLGQSRVIIPKRSQNLCGVSLFERR